MTPQSVCTSTQFTRQSRLDRAEPNPQLRIPTLEEPRNALGAEALETADVLRKWADVAGGQATESGRGTEPVGLL